MTILVGSRQCTYRNHVAIISKQRQNRLPDTGDPNTTQTNMTCTTTKKYGPVVRYKRNLITVIKEKTFPKMNCQVIRTVIDPALMMLAEEVKGSLEDYGDHRMGMHKDFNQ